MWWHCSTARNHNTMSILSWSIAMEAISPTILQSRGPSVKTPSDCFSSNLVRSHRNCIIQVDERTFSITFSRSHESSVRQGNRAQRSETTEHPVVAQLRQEFAIAGEHLLEDCRLWLRPLPPGRKHGGDTLWISNGELSLVSRFPYGQFQ